MGVRQYSTLFMKEGAEHSYDSLDFNIACIESKIIPKTELKPVYAESFADSDGESVYLPSQRKVQGADIEFVFCLRGDYTTANTDLYAFMKYLTGSDGSGVWFDFYDVYSHVARKHCRLKSISEEDHYRNSAGEGYTTFKMTVRATRNSQEGRLDDFASVLGEYAKDEIIPSLPVSDMRFTRPSSGVSILLSSLGMVIINSHITGRIDSKEIATTDWKDEDGDDSYAGARVYVEPYDIEYTIGYLGAEFSAADRVRELFDYLCVNNTFSMSDMASGVTYKGVTALSYEEEKSHRDATYGNLDEDNGFLVLTDAGGSAYEEFVTLDGDDFTYALNEGGDIVLFNMRFRVTDPTL